MGFCRLLMKRFLFLFACIVPLHGVAQQFSCPAGQADMMKYFVLDQRIRRDHFLDGKPNPIHTEVFPDEDFAASGYWFWIKSPKAHGFDVKSFDEKYIYMRATELTWEDNTSFKRFDHDLPTAARCVPEGGPGPEIKVSDTHFQYFSACRPYKRSTLGTVVNNLDAPEHMDLGGNTGSAWTRVLHYRYNCDQHFQNCKVKSSSTLRTAMEFGNGSTTAMAN